MITFSLDLFSICDVLIIKIATYLWLGFPVLFCTLFNLFDLILETVILKKAGAHF